MTTCPECGEFFLLSKPDGEEGMAPWYLDVVHWHGVGVPHWVGVVYQHNKGQRYPKNLKAIVEERKAQKKRAVSTRRMGKVEGKRTCPMHPEGCEHEAGTDH